MSVDSSALRQGSGEKGEESPENGEEDLPLCAACWSALCASRQRGGATGRSATISSHAVTVDPPAGNECDASDAFCLEGGGRRGRGGAEGRGEGQ